MVILMLFLLLIYPQQPGLGGPPKSDHNHVLEHSLHQLLREVHHKNSFHPMPHPVTALLGMSKRRCLAGPQAFSRTELLDMADEYVVESYSVCNIS